MLMNNGTVAMDEELSKHVLEAGMTHMNAYAIPKQINEKDAFDAVKAERDRIIATETPAAIVEQAKTCL